MPKIRPLHSPTMRDILSSAPELASLFRFCVGLFHSLSVAARHFRLWLWLQFLPGLRRHSKGIFEQLFAALCLLVVVLCVLVLSGAPFSARVFYLYITANTMVLAKACIADEYLADERPQHCIVHPEPRSPSLCIMKSLILVLAGLKPSFVVPPMLHSSLDSSHYLLVHIAPQAPWCVAMRPLYDYLRVPVKVVETYADMAVGLAMFKSSRALGATYAMLLVLKLEHSPPGRQAVLYVVEFIDLLICYFLGGKTSSWKQTRQYLTSALSQKEAHKAAKPGRKKKSYRPAATSPRIASFALDTIEVINDMK